MTTLVGLDLLKLNDAAILHYLENLFLMQDFLPFIHSFVQVWQESLANAKVSAQQPWYIGHKSAHLGSPSNVNIIYTSLRSTFSIFIRLAVVASQTFQLAQNSEKSFSYTSSWPSKVDDYGTNRKCICEFLLVINSNFGPILHRF